MNSKQNSFTQGLDLSETFFERIVKPILLKHLPQLKYSSALIGAGSEVLGFDTEMSSDHDWGPRLLLFLEVGDELKYSAQIKSFLEQDLPEKFFGVSVRYGLSKPDAEGKNVTGHHVEIFSVQSYLRKYINIDSEDALTPADWLTIPEQKLRSITAGRVFRDEVGLQKLRQKFAYYPQDVWLYLLASAWNRIEQEEHLMARAGIVGDEIGSALIGARLVRDLMRLCFLMHKQYAPYAKWFGTAFAQLPCGRDLEPTFRAALCAQHWKDREKHLSTAYKYVAAIHNRLNITTPQPEDVSQFHDRPFSVISKGAFSREIAAKISNPEVLGLMQNRLIGSIDQISDNTDILEDSTRRLQLRTLYL